MRFSQRIGEKEVRTVFQVKSMDDDLRISLWNVFYLCVVKKHDLYRPWDARDSKHGPFLFPIWTEHLKASLMCLHSSCDKAIDNIHNRYYDWKWYEVYDFIEFLASGKNPYDKKEIIAQANRVLEREMAGYRFVGAQLARITDEGEIQAIQEAMETAKEKGLSGVEGHLNAAVSKLSDRKDPDYRNSIKESISAVESIAKIIAGDPKAELAPALKKIEEHFRLHGAMKQGFLSLYGYTSDEGGIRHAMIEESNCDFDDAKFMLVSCSAFIHFLIGKAGRAGIPLESP